jgi:hypothetical protein
MKKNWLLFTTCIFISVTALAQYNDEDTDAYSFFSAAAGLNFTQMQSSGDIYKQSRFGTGYSIGLQFTMFPDYDYQHFFLRLGAYYSKEVSESKNTLVLQQVPVVAQAEINSARVEIFFAYRFATEATVDAYLGGGFQFQQKLNKDDEAYTFLNPDGTETPVFNKENTSLPRRFQAEGPKAALGPFAELGAFIPVGNKQLGIASGISYAFFFTNSSAEVKIEKANLYITASYELF